jgi:hypothetical protein
MDQEKETVEVGLDVEELEEIIAPGQNLNHNEMLLRDDAD